ncbi:MAG: UDP-3-O-(3-hydroxymyristoyl)glucosamine N-acyltransferase [Deltaproteobacteria bacterium]|nr:UDP-3-O-(3-hydroxymyristoyl)glucosamine N-acyltransferase [Deltaproteobacteria bacterium]
MKFSAEDIYQRPTSLQPKIDLKIETVINEIKVATGKQLGGQELIVDFTGDRNAVIGRISAVEHFEHGDMIFVDKPDVVSLVMQRVSERVKPGMVVTSAKLADAFKVLAGANVLTVHAVPLAHAFFKQTFLSRDFSRSGWVGVHPTAVIHETAILDKSVIVEPRAVVGAGTIISRGVRIMAGAVVENDVWIGENSVLHPGTVIGYGCVLGDDVVIEAGTVIGSAGFGYAQDAKRKSHAIPQTGIVVLEDRVRIGAGCCVDRAAYHITRIGAGTKIDNLCHIAHGVQIGEDCLLTAMLCVAGSTKIGNRVMTSGQTGVLDHMNVCDDVVLVHRAGVTKNIDVPGAYAGLPVQPLSDYMKNTAVLRNAVDLRRRISELEEKVPT